MLNLTPHCSIPETLAQIAARRQGGEPGVGRNIERWIVERCAVVRDLAHAREYIDTLERYIRYLESQLPGCDQCGEPGQLADCRMRDDATGYREESMLCSRCRKGLAA